MCIRDRTICDPRRLLWCLPCDNICIRCGIRYIPFEESARRKKDGGALLSVYFAVRRSEQDVYVKALLACGAYNGVRPPLYRKAQLCMTRGAAAESVCLYFLYLSSEVTDFTGDCIPYFQEASVFCLTCSDVFGKHTEEQLSLIHI